MNWNDIFADRLRRAIDVAGHTQTSLARALGVLARQVRGYVAGDSFPSVPALRRAALITRHSVDTLLGLAECVECGDTFEETDLHRGICVECRSGC